MITIGLTGGIASGKSTVSHMIREWDIPVLDADVYAREVLNPGEPSYHQVVAAFGSAILRQDDTIDRKKLGAIVFNDESSRQQLNDIVHPAVRDKMNHDRETFRSQGYPAIVLDIPLLFESDREHTVDYVLLVYVQEATQLKRLLNRDGSTRQEALSRIQSQLPLSQKYMRADAVIDNDKSRDQTKQQLYDIFKRWRVM